MYLNNQKYNLLENISFKEGVSSVDIIENQNQERLVLKTIIKQNNFFLDNCYKEAQMIDLLSKKGNYFKLIYSNQDKETIQTISQLQGHSLDKILIKCGGKFSLQTCVLLLHQILKQLRVFQQQQLVHCKISPQHFILGQKNNQNQVYIISFRDIQKANQLTNQVISLWDDFIQFVSFNQLQKQNKIGFKDNLESLFLMIIFFLKGNLPWTQKMTEFQSIEDYIIFRHQISIENLCKELPNYFQEKLHQITQANSYTEFDIQKMIKELNQLQYELFHQDLSSQQVFDWDLIDNQILENKISI